MFKMVDRETPPPLDGVLVAGCADFALSVTSPTLVVGVLDAVVVLVGEDTAAPKVTDVPLDDTVVGVGTTSTLLPLGDVVYAIAVDDDVPAVTLAGSV
jgi:hypothetical protein